MGITLFSFGVYKGRRFDPAQGRKHLKQNTMIQFFKTLFGKKKKEKELKYFLVEAVLMIDENTVLTSFACPIMAESKGDAKWQIKNRAFVKVGAVVNKHKVDKFLTKK